MQYPLGSVLRAGVWLLAPVVVAVSALQAEEANPAAPEALIAALRAEIAGDTQLRSEKLEKALQDEPENPLLRWHSGFLRTSTRWVSLDEFMKQAKSRAALKDYHQLRGQSEPTVESQWKLAEFCRQHNLKDQERVHLSAVVELDTNHAAARGRLGYHQVDGQWHTAQEIAAAKQHTKDVAAALRQRRGELTGLRDGLRKGDISHREALERLRTMKDPAVIPAWETLLSMPLAAGGEAVVAALAEMPDVAASLSLARHALLCPWEAVQDSAFKALQKRDEHSFIPSLLQSMRSPWLATAELLTEPSGRLIYRYSLFADGQDKQQLTVFDQAFNLEGIQSAAAGQAGFAARVTNNAREQARRRENLFVAEYNRRVSHVLQRVTGVEGINSPEDWWQWWNDHNGIYYEGDKPLQQSYAYRQTTVVGEPPQSVPSSGRPATRDSKDCLAGGTPVWTELGPVAVDRIKMGDVVLSQNLVTGEVAFKPVLRTTVRAPEPLMRISLGSETVRASGGHPFWVAGKGWVRTHELKAGMVLHGFQGPAIVEEVVTEEKASRSFNLVVDDFHSYFAGSSKVLSHDNSIREPLAQNLPGLRIEP